MDAIIIGSALGAGYAWYKWRAAKKRQRDTVLGALRAAAARHYGAPSELNGELALATVAARTVWALFGVEHSTQLRETSWHTQAAIAHALCYTVAPLTRHLNLSEARVLAMSAALLNIDYIPGALIRLHAPALAAKRWDAAEMAGISGLSPAFFKQLEACRSAFARDYSVTSSGNKTLGTWISGKILGFSNELCARLVGRANAREFEALGTAEHWQGLLVQSALGVSARP